MATVNPDPDFDVVLLGTDIGIYGLARAFHERYGIVSTVISRVIAGPIKNSRIIDTIDIGEDSGRPETLAALEREGKKRKADGDADKGPKNKKKKEEPKAKVPKPKGTPSTRTSPHHMKLRSRSR